MSRSQMLVELSTFAATVYNTRPVGWSEATKFNSGGTGFMHQFYMWTLVRHLNPKHIIESGSYNGLGTWILRKAAPQAQITVVSPRTPHIYVDKHNKSRYFTEDSFCDFSTIDWNNAKHLDRSKTLILLFDDHQSGYRRMLEAHARGFHHLMFDDNVHPQKSDHFSLEGACAASYGLLNGLDKWDDFRGIKTQWYPWKHGQFNVTVNDLLRVGDTFNRLINIYAKMPPLWAADLTSPDFALPLMNNTDALRFIQTHSLELRSTHAEAVAYQGFVYVNTKSSHHVDSHTLYYPNHVKVNGYSGILPKASRSCSTSNLGTPPNLLHSTNVADDWHRNYGAGMHFRLD